MYYHLGCESYSFAIDIWSIGEINTSIVILIDRQ